MYNRYVRAPDGGYTRVPQPEEEPPRGESARQPPPEEPRGRKAPPKEGKGSDFIDGILEKLHLGDVDSGDLLILLLLFFLFRQDADEEVLIALGLLLIL